MRNDTSTREPQYQGCLDLDEKKGRTRLGLMSNFAWDSDPRRLLFLLSRYKFVSKMLSGADRVLEVGCADAFGTRVVQQEVGRVTAIDFDPVFVDDVNSRSDPDWPLDCRVHDMLHGPIPEAFDAAYSLDVLEHIRVEDESAFIRNIADSLAARGTLVIGTPTEYSQPWASEPSKQGHVNCKTEAELRATLGAHFHSVLLFSMNDEVVHTGFYPLAHYFMAVCTGRRDGS
jgi:2-polyprenyl-3-methyl-5-hydroxy-6-metoxy-1,4-benzoquinol methylase